MTERPFIKMHGAGNDFVILDLRDGQPAPSADDAAHIADRHRGVGCDQVILIGESETGTADAGLTFLNADGSESGACGNGTRCAAWLMLEERGQDHMAIETLHGVLDCQRSPDGRITVDMGKAKTDWQDIPLSEERDTLHLRLHDGPLKDPVGVSMGNPHAVFFVDDVLDIPIATLGPRLEHNALFPERANIGVAAVQDRKTIRLRVWERGSGMTLACGSGACAAVVAAVRRDLTDRKVSVELDGGTLDIEWLADDGHVLMTGPIAISFRGHLDPLLLDQ